MSLQRVAKINRILFISHKEYSNNGLKHISYAQNKLIVPGKQISYRLYSKDTKDPIKDMLNFKDNEMLNSAVDHITEKGAVYDKKPFKFMCEKGKRYFWCSCGLSHAQPFCDKECTDFYAPMKTNLKPFQFIAPETKEYWFCNCKQTNRKPFCDGSHKSKEVEESYKEKTRHYYPAPRDT